MDHRDIEVAIGHNHALASALRIAGTPSFVIGEEVFQGYTDLPTLQRLIQRERERRKPSRR
ncbi:hypothetical protein EVC37_16045 [Methylocaldum sp. BRCS4]|jgi:protein-disulfide isomerase|nr:thioredoxin domain-containing protein [Methylocaldum sp. 14B]MVF23113.1 hypothetical protein [Methylocaldum sp. BRCS4]